MTRCQNSSVTQHRRYGRGRGTVFMSPRCDEVATYSPGGKRGRQLRLCWLHARGWNAVVGYRMFKPIMSRKTA